MDRTHEIIDELEALATSIYHVSSVLVHFYFQNKIIFLGHPPVYLSKSPPPQYKLHYAIFILARKHKICSFYHINLTPPPQKPPLFLQV